VNPFESLDALDRATAQIEAVFEHPTAPPDARRIAAALHAAFPAAVRAACVLRGPDGDLVAILDHDGQPCPDEEGKLAGLPPANPDPARVLSRLGGSVVVGEAPTGLLALVFPPTADAEMGQARLWLRTAARVLALALSAAAARAAAAALADEVKALDRLAHAGELAGPLAHEFSNFLNVLLLQMTVLEYQLPQGHRTDLAEVRRQGHLANELIGRFHQQRRAQPPPAAEVHLPGLLARVAEELRDEPPVPGVPVALASSCPSDLPAGAILLVLGAGPPDAVVIAPLADLKRLLRFLLRNAIRAAGHGGRTVRADVLTTPASGARLVVEDNGPALSADGAVRVFEAAASGRPGVEPLELAACRSILRRLGGRIQAEALPGAGLRLVVEFAPPGRA
jgi:signal transduction histidine kinase